MTNRQAAQETRNISVCAFLDDPINAAIYAMNVAFSTIATKMKADCAAAVIAGTNAATDNRGYSVEKAMAKEAASELAAQLCASSKVKLDILGNLAISKSLNGNITHYFAANDAECTNRLMNVYDIMDANLVMITADYLKPAQLATFLSKINTYTNTKGSSTLVNNNSPVLTKAYNEAIKLTNADLIIIKQLVKFYKTSEFGFYNSMNKACKMPAIAVRHTPVIVTITDAYTTEVLPGVDGTLTKSKELPSSNSYGIMTYATVLAGNATATFAKAGYITAIVPLNILRGKTNAVTVALTPGIMNAEQIEAIKIKVAQAIADDTAMITAKKKARKAALAAIEAAKLLIKNK